MRLTIPVAAITSAILLFVVAEAEGLRINASSSAPRGIWIAKPIADHPIKRGTWIAICPPVLSVSRAMAGFMPYGDCPVLDVVPLLKPVRAITGDVVRLQVGRNAEVNGVTLPNTISKPALPAWPDGEYTVKPGEVWIFSSYSDKSFDSRYFGSVKVSEIQSAALPLLTEDF